MTKISRAKYGFLAATFVLSTVVGQFANITTVSAAGPLKVWSGAGGDYRASNDDNWQGGIAPDDGDSISIPSYVGVDTSGENAVPIEFNNDIADLKLTGITITSGAGGYDGAGASFGGQNIAVSGEIVNNSGKEYTFDPRVMLLDDTTARGINFRQGVEMGSSNLTIIAGAGACSSASTGYLYGSGNLYVGGGSDSYVEVKTSLGDGFTGSVRVESGNLLVEPSNIGSGVKVSTQGSGSVALLDYDGGGEFAFPLFLSGTGHLKAVSRSSAVCHQPGVAAVGEATRFVGGLTLGNNYLTSGNRNLEISGNIKSNGYIIKPAEGSVVTLKMPLDNEGSKNVNLDGYSEESVTVEGDTVATLNGTRKTITVAPKGILKGTGSAEFMYVGGTISPGNSPGALNALVFLGLDEGSIYQVEIQNKNSYDKVVVGKDWSASAAPSHPGPVYIDDLAILDLRLWGEWDIKSGDKFTIIDNQSTEAVAGSFKDLPEGAEIKIGKAVFTISYVGGDGNDVVLTATTTAKGVVAPNTGAASIIKSNPALVAALGVVSAVAVLGLSMRRKSSR